MRKRAIALVLVLFALTTPVSAAPPIECSAPDDNRCEAWTRTWAPPETPTYGTTWAEDSTVSPDGRTLFVTGSTPGSSDGESDIATIAFDAHTGNEIWVHRYDSGAADRDYHRGEALALNPDGSRLYVAGSQSSNATSDSDWAVLCFSAADGKLLWAANMPPGSASASDVAVSPDGSRVYATGDTDSENESSDVLTVAFDAATGDMIWQEEYEGSADPGHGGQIEVTPSGDRVFVLTTIGWSESAETTLLSYSNIPTDANLDWATVALTDTWTLSKDQMALSPSGKALFISRAQSLLTKDTRSYERTRTVRVDAETGKIRWNKIEKMLRSPAIEIAPAGKTIFIGGPHAPSFKEGPAMVRARNARTGELKWQVIARKGRPASFWDAGFATGSETFVMSGVSQRDPDRYDPQCGGYCNHSDVDMITVAFNTKSRSVEWSARSNHPKQEMRRAVAFTVSVGSDGWIYAAGQVGQAESDPEGGMLLAGYGPS
jgi:DNA-binding beta-propeller fold protein YncE